MWICRDYQFGSLEHLYDKSSTHSVSGIELVVASNKVVSTGENARSAHGEILKVESLRTREGWKRKRWEGDPRSHGKAVNACVCLFLYNWVFRLSSSLLLVFDFLVPRGPEMAVHSFR